MPQPETRLRRRNSEKALTLRTEKLEPSRPLRNKPNTPDPQNSIAVEKVKKDLSTNVLKIIKKSPAPPTPESKSYSILPPTLKPKPERVNKEEKYVNNNTLWKNANVAKTGKKVPFLNIR